MNSTITDQMDQTENPMCSAATDQIRLRRAIFLLPASHAAVSSGSQSGRRCERASVIPMASRYEFFIAPALRAMTPA